MARCEDFPCCGHENGCCPDYDESGKQLNMKCVCGATLPLHSKFSICLICRQDADGYPDYPDDGLGDRHNEDGRDTAEDWWIDNDADFDDDYPDH